MFLQNRCLPPGLPPPAESRYLGKGESQCDPRLTERIQPARDSDQAPVCTKDEPVAPTSTRCSDQPIQRLGPDLQDEVEE
jgi:hypothetical protein